MPSSFVSFLYPHTRFEIAITIANAVKFRKVQR